jgi:hypothetical protein
MLCDETNPRSVAYQLVECVAHVGHLNLGVQGENKPADHGLATSLLQTVRNADVVRISRKYEAGDSDALNALLDTIGPALPSIVGWVAARTATRRSASKLTVMTLNAIAIHCGRLTSRSRACSPI